MKELKNEKSYFKNKVINIIHDFTVFIIILLALFNAYIYGTLAVMTVFHHDYVGDISKEEIVYQLDIDEKVKIDDRVISFTDIIYTKNGDLNIFFKSTQYKHVFSGWSMGYLGDISDNLGNTYFNSSGRASGGIVSYHHKTLENFSKDADTLIINYDHFNRKYRIEFPLRIGDVDE